MLLLVAVDAAVQGNAKGEVGRTERQTGQYCHTMVHLMGEVEKMPSGRRFGAAVVLEPEPCLTDHYL